MIKMLLQGIATMLLMLLVAAPASAQTDRNQNRSTQQKRTTDKNKTDDKNTVDPAGSQNQNMNTSDRPMQDQPGKQMGTNRDTIPPGTQRGAPGSGNNQGQGVGTGTDRPNMGTDRGAPGSGINQGQGTTGGVRAGQRQRDSSILLYGIPMYSNRPILENAATSTQHSTLVGAIRSANLTTSLSGTGPFTVFAPVNAAFDRLPAGTLDQMTRSENRTQLTNLLNYHVVQGLYDFDRLAELARSTNNTLRTVAGQTLTVVMNGPHNILVRDESGHTANIVTYDIYQSNGVVHSIDTVLMPRATSK